MNQDAKVKYIFDKIYPLLARQIFNDYKITTGICLEVGSGVGRLGIELAKLTSLKVYCSTVIPRLLLLLLKISAQEAFQTESVLFRGAFKSYHSLITVLI